MPAVDAAAVLAAHTLYDPLSEGVEWDTPRCANCLDYWRGDAETGGCEAVLLAREVVALREERDWFKGEMEQFMRAASANHARVALLEGLLREVEWSDDVQDGEGACPVCGMWPRYGHRSDCRLAAALAGGEETRPCEG